MRFLTALLLATIAIGCSPSRLSPSEYLDWANRPDNPLKQVRQLGDYEFTVQYRPIDLLACEFLNTTSPDQFRLDSIRKATGNALFFTFRFKNNSNTNTNNIDPVLLSYLSSEIQQDFSIIAGNDTISPASCQYERDYGMTPYQTINLVFDGGKKISTDITLLYNDQILQTGPIAFHYNEASLADIPQIQL